MSTITLATTYVFPGMLEVQASDVVIICTLLVRDRMTYLLFNTRSTSSYVTSLLPNGLDLHCDLLDMPIRVSTHFGLFVLVEKVYRYYLLTSIGSKT